MDHVLDRRRPHVRAERGFFLGDYQGLGVSGTTFTPFFGATLAAQANGQVGSDIFATTAD